MSLEEKIKSDLVEAMKAKEELKLGALRMLKADIMKFQTSGKNEEVTDEVVQDLIKRGIKQRKDAIEGFEKGGNTEAAQKERDEIAILEVYMPEQMSEDAVREIVQGVINDMSATPADFGKVMGAVMGKVKGQADGGIVNKLVKELLS